MLRVAFYYNHYNTLGHSTRIFSLVKGLKEYYKKKIEIFVLQGGKEQSSIPLYRFSKVYLLPYSIDKRGLFIEENRRIYKRIVSSGKLDKMLKERLFLIRKILNQCKPDFFITEYFPFGQEFWTFEIPYILRFLKDNYNKCKIVSSCGYLNWIENTYGYVKEFYDGLLIHLPEEVCAYYHLYLHNKGAKELDRVFVDFHDKIFFTGFVLDSFKVKHEKLIRRWLISKKKNQKLILVSRGGGIVNKKIILTSFLVAKRNKNLFFIVCCGPATSPEEFKRYRKLAQGIENLKLVKSMFQFDFDTCLKSADLSINMAGYNTTIRLLYYGKKTILVPYYSSEQRWRADLVKKYLPSRIIQEKELVPSLLERDIYQLLREEKKSFKIDKNWFSGVPDTIKYLKCMI